MGTNDDDWIGQERAQALTAHLGPLLPDTLAGYRLAASVAACEAAVAAALALWVQGQAGAALAVLGSPGTDEGRAALLPVIAAFKSAADAINAAVGDDADRGRVALAVLEERSIEFSAAQRLLARRAEGNDG
jgi:hypothetical protein